MKQNEWKDGYVCVCVCVNDRGWLLSLTATIRICDTIIPLQWRHNGHDGVSNHQPHHCLLNRLFGRRSKKTSKFRVTGLCVGNSPGTGEFPAQMASNAENVSIWWRHHTFASVNCWLSVDNQTIVARRDIWNTAPYLLCKGADQWGISKTNTP